MDVLDSVPLIARSVLGLVLVNSSISKFAHPQDFALGVLNYSILPRTLGLFAARLIPISEMVLGAALLGGIATPVVALLTLGLFTVFLGAVGINLARGRHVTCHCFGAADLVLWLGSPAQGALVFAVYGLGRAVPVAIAGPASCRLGVVTVTLQPLRAAEVVKFVNAAAMTWAATWMARAVLG